MKKITFKIAVLALGLGIIYHPNIAEAKKQDTSQNQSSQIQVKVTSKVLSDKDMEPLPFATVVLIDKITEKQYAENADENGNIVWEYLAPGEYEVRGYYVGFENYVSSLRVPSNEKSFNMPTIEFASKGSKELKEVKIVDYRDLIEDRPDGIVYNADQDRTNLGTTADELLRKVPMVTVDLDGNVSMRGSQNIKVLIDNKPSTILAQSVSDALKQIPSDQVKSVEVITSPGAKYDGEGTSGVINIITKKSVISGINGMVNAGGNYTFGYNDINGHGGGMVNFRRDKYGISLRLGAGRWMRHSEGFSERVEKPESTDPIKMQQEMQSKMGGPFLWGGLNFDYQFDSLNTFFAGVNFNPGNHINENSTRTIFDAAGVDYTRNIKDEAPRMNYSFSASYNKIFKKNPKQALDILALYSLGTSNNKYNLEQINQGDAHPNYFERSTNDANNNEFTIQTDYTHPFNNDKQKLEVGAKYIHRDVISDYYLEYKSSADNVWTENPNRTNRLDYTQQVAALYAQLTTKIIGNLDAVIGVRNEYTDIQAMQRDFGGKFDDNYNSFLPNVILTYGLKDFNKIKLAYFQRIGRPSIEYINPYINYSDEYNLKQGNPTLDPEKSHNIELGYSGIFGGSTINLTGFYRFTNNAIEMVGEIDNNVSLSTYGNYAKNSTTGLNLFFSTRLFNNWMINVNGDLYYKDIESGSLNMRNSGLEYRAHAYTTYRLPKGWSIEGFGMYNARSVMLQGQNSGYYYYSFGARKSLFGGKADVNLSLSNIFNPSVKYTMEHNYLNGYYYNESMNAARGIRIGFSYRFGKMSFSPRSKKIENDDLLRGGSEQSGGEERAM